MTTNPTTAAARLVGGQVDAMKTAAGNNAGAMTGFMGMGMAMNAGGMGGMNAQNLFAMGQQQPQAAPQPAAPQPAPERPQGDTWTWFLRNNRERKILSGVRSEEAGAEDRACWKLEVQMRYDSNRKVLSGMRILQSLQTAKAWTWLLPGTVNKGDSARTARSKETGGSSVIPLR